MALHEPSLDMQIRNRALCWVRGELLTWLCMLCLSTQIRQMALCQVSGELLMWPCALCPSTHRSERGLCVRSVENLTWLCVLCPSIHRSKRGFVSGQWRIFNVAPHVTPLYARTKNRALCRVSDVAVMYHIFTCRSGTGPFCFSVS